ncbi:MAG: hypothetical protein ACREPA_08970 [Candidatus Dormibacteraceae bacterium]
MSGQLIALAAVAAAVIAAVAVERLRAWHARRGLPRSLAAPLSPGEPYILYFTGAGCTVCHTHQEPALARLPEARVERVDAIERSDLAGRYRVYTLPTTIVMSAAGDPLHVNYGYATAAKLRRQLEGAHAGGS